MATEWGDLRDDVIRVQLRDTSETAPVFTDAELLTYYANAIRAYSRVIQHEVIGSLNLTNGETDYNIPTGCKSVIEIYDGTNYYEVVSIFGGKMTLSPMPGASIAATIKYRAVHIIPASDSVASSYADEDEELVVKHVKAQAFEVLAGDGAKYYKYTEGDITEEQGRTQQQFRDEANALYTEFNKAVEQAKLLADELQGTVSPTIAEVITRKPAERQAGIYKTR